jgi:hypothetical protein
LQPRMDTDGHGLKNAAPRDCLHPCLSVFIRG